MNKTIAFLSASILTVTAANAVEQSYYVNSVPVTIALTKKVTTAALYPRDEAGKEDKTGELTEEASFDTSSSAGVLQKSTALTGTKVVTSKISNKEVLAQLLSNNLLDGSVSGWSIQATATTEEGLSYSVFAAKTGLDNIELFTIEGVSSSSSASSTVTSVNTDGETTGIVHTGAATFESRVSFDFDGTPMTAIFTGATKDMAYYPDTTDKSSLTTLAVPAAGKIATLIGSDENGVIQGSIAFGAAKAVKVSSSASAASESSRK